jgi:hypothetical protein
MENHTDKLRNACHEAFLFLKKLKDPKNADIQSKLEYVVGSYDYDKNPVGLYEIGSNALKIIKNIKANNPKKVSNQLITNLEECLKK